MNRAWKSCEDCEKKTRNIRIFKGEHLCYNCFQKKTTSMSIVGLEMNLSFNEPITSQSIVSINLTETQNELLSKRLKYIFPYKNHKINLKAGITEYIRELILADTEIWERIEKEKIKKENGKQK